LQGWSRAYRRRQEGLHAPDRSAVGEQDLVRRHAGQGARTRAAIVVTGDGGNTREVRSGLPGEGAVRLVRDPGINEGTLDNWVNADNRR
jgi:hypothetical protein